MSDFLLAASRRVRARYRNPWLTPGTLIPLLLVLLSVAVLSVAVYPLPAGRYGSGGDFTTAGAAALVRYRSTRARRLCPRGGSALSLGIGAGATLIASAGGILLGTLGLAPRAVRQTLVRLLDAAGLSRSVAGAAGDRSAGTRAGEYVTGGRAGRHCRICAAGARVLQVRLSGYVQHAVALGESPLTIILRHIIPNTLRPLLVLATVGMGYAVLSASALSFWTGRYAAHGGVGALLSEGRNFLDSAVGQSAARQRCRALRDRHYAAGAALANHYGQRRYRMNTEILQQPLLRVAQLSVSFPSPQGVEAVKSLSFSVNPAKSWRW